MTPTEKREIIETLRTDYSVRQICDTLGFNRSNLYYQPQEDAYEAVLREEIEKLAASYPKYGYRRITKLLLRMGYTVGYRRVARLMKSANLSVIINRATKTTQSQDSHRQWLNRLDNLDICRRDQVWVADITYVQINKQFVYMSVLMDVFTRMIRGWQLSRHLDQPLTLDTLHQALRQGVCEIHHSDQGVQYLSNEYISTLNANGIEISLAYRGRPWENGYVERFIRTLKEEEILLNEYDNIMDAKTRIGNFIEQVYTYKRPHSALGYLTPNEFEQKQLT